MERIAFELGAEQTQATVWQEEDGTFSFCLRGVDGRSGLTSIEECMEIIASAVLGRKDFAAWHQGKISAAVRRILDACTAVVPHFSRIELWGMPSPRGGEEDPAVAVRVHSPS